MSETKISIITVCKNAENAIERTMLSVVTQSCFNENIEYLIIDGASTDKTTEIIKQYADKYPIKWISEPDSGIYNAMNKGIKLATGDYLLFLNAGDYLVHYNVIKSLMDLFESNKFDLICGNILYVGVSSEKYGVTKIEDKLDAKFFFKDALPHPATFYRKELFEKFGGYDENFKIISDHILNKKLLYDHKVTFKHIDLIVSVFFGDGISSINQELYLQEKRIFQEEYFSKNEIKKIKKQIRRQQNKSLLRFLAKILMNIHNLWANR